MLLIVFLFLGIVHTSHVILASEKKPAVSGKAVKILYNDPQDKDAQKSLAEYPIEFVEYSRTIKGLLEDLGEPTEIPIPLDNTTRNGLDCLIGIIGKELYNLDNKLVDARKDFQEFKRKCAAAPIDILIQSNFLDMHASIDDAKYKKKERFKKFNCIALCRSPKKELF